MVSISFYDLDRTITRNSTFTPFMVHAAWKDSKLRLVGLPLWLAAMLCYGMGFINRKSLKQFGFGLFIGRRLSPARADILAARFADWFLERQLLPGAAESLVSDRLAGRRLVLVTAAPDVYASELARRLGMDDVIATRHVRHSDGTVLNLIIGENCYGAEKLARVTEWMRREKLARESCDIKVYSDHLSDAPLLEFANEAILVTRRAKLAAFARYRGWRTANFARRAGHAPVLP